MAVGSGKSCVSNACTNTSSLVSLLGTVLGLLPAPLHTCVLCMCLHPAGACTLTLTSCCHSGACGGWMSSIRNRSCAAPLGTCGGSAGHGCFFRALLPAAVWTKAFAAGTVHLGSGASGGSRNLALHSDNTRVRQLMCLISPNTPDILFCNLMQQVQTAHLLTAAFSAGDCRSLSRRPLVSVVDSASACWPIGAGSSGAMMPCVACGSHHHMTCQIAAA